MKNFRRIIFTITLLLPLFANASEENSLYKKLVEGSPWLFTTKYESTQMSFRLSQDGEIQRQRSDGTWNSMTVTESGVSYKTGNGHSITIKLDENGIPITIHSKHQSTFKSLK